MPVELRDLEPAVIDDMINRIERKAEAIAREENVSIDIQLAGREEPALTDVRIQDAIEKAATESSFSTVRMPSGAGHDAQLLAQFGVPTGMIFVPSKDGVSHSP